MEGVIPNSRVVIVPPSAKPGEETSIQDWRRELYLRPGEWIPWVTLTVIVATIVLACIVIFLHLNEKVRGEFIDATNVCIHPYCTSGKMSLSGGESCTILILMPYNGASIELFTLNDHV
jgi:hypothetical protein